MEKCFYYRAQAYPNGTNNIWSLNAPSPPSTSSFFLHRYEHRKMLCSVYIYRPSVPPLMEDPHRAP